MGAEIILPSNGAAVVSSTFGWSKSALMADAVSADWRAARALDSGTVLLAYPEAGALTVDAGDLIFLGGSTLRVVRSEGADVGLYAYNGWIDSSPASQAANLLGDAVLRVGLNVVAIPSGEETAYDWGFSGETAPTNHTISLTFDENRLRYFAEHDGGENVEVLWAFPLVNASAPYIVLVRTDIGGTFGEVRLYAADSSGTLVQLAVTGATSDVVGAAINNGDYATVRLPTSGTSGDVTVANFTGSKTQGVTFVQLLDTTTTIEAEQAILDAAPGDGTG